MLYGDGIAFLFAHNNFWILELTLTIFSSVEYAINVQVELESYHYHLIAHVNREQTHYIRYAAYGPGISPILSRNCVILRINIMNVVIGISFLFFFATAVFHAAVSAPANNILILYFFVGFVV